MRFIEEMQQESFWSEYVTKFGGERLKLEPKFLGWEDWHFRSHDGKVQRRLEGSDLKACYAYPEAKKS